MVLREAGSINVENVAGDVVAQTSSGSIILKNVSGRVVAQTLTGAIAINEVTGFVKAITNNGKIDWSRRNTWSLNKHSCRAAGRGCQF